MRSPFGVASALAALLLSAHCRDQQEAAAAATPEIELRGEVTNANSSSALAPVDGRVAALTVTEGSRVQAGAVIATLANPSIQRDLAYARAQVALARRRLATAARPAPASRHSGDARVRAAASILANRQSKRDRYRELYATHDVTKQELEDAENEYSAALRDWLAERERANPAVIEADTGLLQLELEKAQTEEALAVNRQSQLTILAPITGTVTRIHASAGTTVFPRDAIVEITDTSKAQLRAAIAPELLRYVRSGTKLEVKVFTVPPRRFTAPVRAIVPGSAGAILLIDVPNPEGVLQPGQQAVITVR